MAVLSLPGKGPQICMLQEHSILPFGRSGDVARLGRSSKAVTGCSEGQLWHMRSVGVQFCPWGLLYNPYQVHVCLFTLEPHSDLIGTME